MSHFSHPEPKLAEFPIRENERIFSVILDRLYILIFFFYQSQISFCSKVQTISVTAVSDVDYMLSGSGAAFSSFLLQPPPAAAVIQLWYQPAGRLKELLPHPDMWAWPWRSAWLTENSTVARLLHRGSNVCANMTHSSCGEYSDKTTMIANLFSRQLNRMFPVLLSWDKRHDSGGCINYSYPQYVLN